MIKKVPTFVYKVELTKQELDDLMYLLENTGGSPCSSIRHKIHKANNSNYKGAWRAE